jgi:anaphase-promoting complex subunit 3
MRRPHDALSELDLLKNMMPDDAKVHFLLGRTYKMLNKRSSALRHFTVALNLDPKASNLIKECLEQLQQDSDGEVVDDDDDEME